MPTAARLTGADARGRRIPMFRSFTPLLVFTLVGCGSSGAEQAVPVEAPPTSEEALESPAEPSMPWGASLLDGEFEYVATHNGREIRRSIRAHGSELTRLVDGRITATASFQVVEDEPGRVTLEVRESGRTAVRRTFEFIDGDHMFDVVTPEQVFERTDFVPPSEEDGALLGEGSGEALPE